MSVRQLRRVSSPWPGGRTPVLVPDIDPAETTWQELARCAEVDPEIFFPEKGQPTAPAKKVCLSCEVRTECLEDAIAKDERFGVRGGMSERERRRLAASREAGPSKFDERAIRADQLRSQGLTYAVIGERLGITEHQAKDAVRRATKLGLTTEGHAA